MKFDRKIELSIVADRGVTAWQSFLDSEGISWTLFNSVSDISCGSILIIPGKSNKKFKFIAKRVLACGGIVIVEQSGGLGTGGRNCQVVSYPYHVVSFSRLTGDSEPDTTSVTIKKVDFGTLIQLPFLLQDLWCDRRVGKKFIVIKNEEVPYIWENLSFVAKKNVRKVLVDVLWRAHHAAGLPLVQKWYWPNGAKSFFSFRADMDAGNEKGMQTYLDAVRPWVESLSLFVHGSAYADKEWLLKNVANLGAEVGNHTFTHYVYSKPAHNRVNIELTEQLLGKVGIRPKGFVGPASFWQPNMYELLQEKGYQYTSSFGLDHDNFPYFPTRDGGGTYDLVEIPFHCLGDRFPKFDMEMGTPEVEHFFDQLIEKKYHLCEPMFIYGHPDMSGRLGYYPELVKHICKKALSYDDVVTGNMADIAAWWRRRHAATATIEYDKESHRVIATDYQGSLDVYWSIQISDDCKYLVSGQDIQDGVALNSLHKYKKINLTISPHENIGEVVDMPPEKQTVRSKVGRWRRELRRKRRMIKELNSVCLQSKGVAR